MGNTLSIYSYLMMLNLMETLIPVFIFEHPKF